MREWLKQLSSGQEGFDESGELCILQGRLYLAALQDSPVAQINKVYITLSKKMRYVPFCADFGPFNLGTLHSTCDAINNKLQDPQRQTESLVYYTSQDPKDITNAIFLLGAFLCLHLGATAEEAWQPFSSLPPHMCLPYRDATWVKSTYDLHVQDCWSGLVRAVEVGLYNIKTFNKHEYMYYDNPANGDLHVVVPGKLVAFRGPRNDTDENSLRPEAYLEVFKELGVHGIVRLNKPEYRRAVFQQAGFTHHDLVFRDCSVPTRDIVDSFLRLAEELQPGHLLAVHCLAGLGRTGTLIALYMMKHYGFTANSAIGWLRVCRPGSVIGAQQHYLADMQPQMQMLGASGTGGLGNGEADGEADLSRAATDYDSNTAVKQANMLADMVRDGMLNRHKQQHPLQHGQDASPSTRSTLPWIGQKRTPTTKIPQRGGVAEAGTSAAGGSTGAASYGRSAGGPTRASSHPHIQSTMPQRCLGSEQPRWAGGGGWGDCVRSKSRDPSIMCRWRTLSLPHVLVALPPRSRTKSKYTNKLKIKGIGVAVCFAATATERMLMHWPGLVAHLYYALVACSSYIGTYLNTCSRLLLRKFSRQACLIKCLTMLRGHLSTLASISRLSTLNSSNKLLKTSYTSSFRPHTLVAQGLMH